MFGRTVLALTHLLRLPSALNLGLFTLPSLAEDSLRNLYARRSLHDTMGIAHIDRLRHIRDLITQAGRYDTSGTRLICFSGADFNNKAHASSDTNPDVRLIDLTALYSPA